MNPLQTNDEFTPVTGGVNIAKYVKQARIAPAVQYHSDVDSHIARLLALHPDTEVAFRNQDLRAIDQAAKLSLLDGLNHILGIQSLDAQKG
jgi:hypothetical protein